MLRYIGSKEEQKKVLLACHVDPTSEHMGKSHTLSQIKERFVWHGMVKDVQSMVSTNYYVIDEDFICKYIVILYCTDSPILLLLCDACNTCLQISKCDVCQMMNRKMSSGVPELHTPSQ